MTLLSALVGSPLLVAAAAVVAVLLLGAPRFGVPLSVGVALLGYAVGLAPAVAVLTGQPALSWATAWPMAGGSFALHLDVVAAFFLLPILVLSALTSIYGVRYLHAHRHPGLAWFCFHALTASMILVVLAANGLLFLLAWELTVLSSFALVLLGGADAETRRAAWLYGVASHLGTAFLLVMFMIMGRETGSLDFAGFGRLATLPTALQGTLFLLAVVGFGTKAGFMPMHVWLPEAHPAAPSHVSAVMSGVMIKTGIYGLVRVVFFLGQPAAWWGWVLLAIGLTSGVLGVLFALAQHDLKRLLAYHSVENIGIIAMGLGLGLLGLHHGNVVVGVLGLAGGLLHVINHAVFKGLLFLGAGAVLEATGSRDLDRQGGLLRRMPVTGTTFLVGCASIAGLPPFNGFISEFLIFLGALHAVVGKTGALTAAGLAILIGLPLIGGLAAACFAKAFSVVFLGAPRSSEAATADEVGHAMRWPMVVLAMICAIIGVFAPLALEPLGRVITAHPAVQAVQSPAHDGGSGRLPPWMAVPNGVWDGANDPPAHDCCQGWQRFGAAPGWCRCPDGRGAMGPAAVLIVHALRPLVLIAGGALALLILLGAMLLVRRRLLAGRAVGTTVTWDCGYAQPLPTMQYTGSSFAQPLTDLFSPVLRTETHLHGPDSYFPGQGRFGSHTADVVNRDIFAPAVRYIAGVLRRLTRIQNGIVQVYVLYIAITLVVLLIGGLL